MKVLVDYIGVPCHQYAYPTKALSLLLTSKGIYIVTKEISPKSLIEIISSNIHDHRYIDIHTHKILLGPLSISYKM